MFLDSRMKIPRILLVEDNSGDARLIIEAIKETGKNIHLDIVTDGTEAMDYLQKNHTKKPDLILLDLNLPKKNGLAVLREIKEDPHLKRIPVIVLTISQAEEDLLQCYDLHANCYIVKPFEITNLMQHINYLLHFWFYIVTLPKNEDITHG